MSAAAASSSSEPEPVKKTRAQEIADRKAAIANAEAIAKLAEQMAALQAHEPLESTMEKSLEARLFEVHAATDLDEFNEAWGDLKYDDMDLLDLNFWESGVVAPPEVEDLPHVEKKSNKAVEIVAQLHLQLKKWENAYHELDLAFGKRALLAYELKIVYKKQREKLKIANELLAKAIADKDNVMGDVVEKALQVKKMIQKEAATVKTASKPCGCNKKCSFAACGCKRAGLGCSDKCGCKNDGCFNEFTYPKNADGVQALAAVEEAELARGELEIKKRQEARRARVAAAAVAASQA